MGTCGLLRDSGQMREGGVIGGRALPRRKEAAPNAALFSILIHLLMNLAKPYDFSSAIEDQTNLTRPEIRSFPRPIPFFTFLLQRFFKKVCFFQVYK